MSPELLAYARTIFGEDLQRPFSELGLDSLDVFDRAAGVFDRFGLTLPSGASARFSTPHALLQALTPQAESLRAPASLAHPTATQRALCDEHDLHPLALTLRWCIRVAPSLDAERLRQAWLATIDAHPAVRQNVAGEHWTLLPLERFAPREIACANEAEASAVLAAEHTALDPAKDALVQLAHLRLPQASWLLLSGQCLVIDFRSAALLTEELARRYGAPFERSPETFFFHHASAEERMLSQPETKARAQDAAARFFGLSALELPSGSGGREVWIRRIRAPQAARAFARAHGASLFGVLTACIQVWLQRMSGMGAFVHGIGTLGRDHVAYANAVGSFSRLAPMAVRIAPEASFQACVAMCEAELTRVLGNADLPLAALAAAMPQRRGKRVPFDVVLIHRKIAAPEGILPEHRWSFEHLAPRGVVYPLEIAIDEGADGEAWIQLSSDGRVDTQALEAWAQALGVLLAACLCEPSRPLEALDLGTPLALAKRFELREGERVGVALVDPAHIELLERACLAVGCEPVSWQDDTAWRANEPLSAVFGAEECLRDWRQRGATWQRELRLGRDLFFDASELPAWPFGLGVSAFAPNGQPAIAFSQAELAMFGRRTGLIGRYDGTGFGVLARSDGAVLVRGRWLAPERIRSVLSTHPLIGDSAVIAARDTTDLTRWLAYVTKKPGGAPPDANDVRRYLRARLPLVPDSILIVEELFRDASSAPDLSRLPLPAWMPAREQAHEEPETESERALAELWAAHFHLARVSRSANFFHLGGDSLQAIYLCREARARGLALTPDALLRHPVLRDLAKAITIALGSQAE